MIIDLAHGAADALGLDGDGEAVVKLEVIAGLIQKGLKKLGAKRGL